ncbi:Shikimate kinase [termite gut metagenome]|jgi:shikimate kinase|uniref:Shikimate kinase n=1 Tax=termite gut metagenome TaxID=433724 RepID=A0A5J4RTL6_9ZZZZ
MVRIFLVGYMGAGKTTLGKALAQKLDLSFIDMDWFIENRFHKKIQDLFEKQGEMGFRELERKILHEVAEFESVIISTGGGTPCFFDNMDVMNQKGNTVFLEVPPDILFSRLRMASISRPVLKGKTEEEMRMFILRTLEERIPFYRRAQYTFSTGKLENHQQINEAIDQLCGILQISKPCPDSV